MPDIYVKDYDTTVSFPDNTSPDVMKAALSKKFPKKEGFIDKAMNVASNVANSDVVQNLVKPTIKAIPRVIRHLATDVTTMAGAPIAGLGDIIGAGAGTLAGGGTVQQAIDNAGQAFIKRQEDTAKGTDEMFLSTPQEKGAVQSVLGTVGWPIEKAQSGWRGIAEWATTGDLRKASDVIEGKSEGSSVAVPILGTGGGISAIVAMGGGKDIKGRVNNAINKNIGGMENITPQVKPYSITSDVKTDLLKPDVENKPVKTSTDLLKDIDTEDAKPPLQLPAPTNVGDGFTFTNPKPKTILRKAPVPEPDYTVGEVNPDLKIEYAPTISKTGKPFKTAKSAELSATQNGNIKGEFEVVPVKDGFGYRKIRAKEEVEPTENVEEKNIASSAESVNIEPMTPKKGTASDIPAKDKPQAEAGLIQEAKKYKTVEEFVNAQGIEAWHGSRHKIEGELSLARGGEQGGDITKNGFTFSTQDVAEKYRYSGLSRDELVKMFGEADAKAIEDRTSILHGRIKMENPLLVDASGYDYKSKHYADPKEGLRSKAFTEYIQQMEDGGHDGIIFTNVKDTPGKKADTTVYFIKDKNKFKTEEQLTSIWNKAQETTPQAEAGKPISEHYTYDNFVSDINKQLPNELFLSRSSQSASTYLDSTILKPYEIEIRFSNHPNQHPNKFTFELPIQTLEDINATHGIKGVSEYVNNLHDRLLTIKNDIIDKKLQEKLSESGYDDVKEIVDAGDPLDWLSSEDIKELQSTIENELNKAHGLPNPSRPPEVWGKSTRGVADILQDINTALGEKGQIGTWEIENARILARKRLADDFARLGGEAKKAGKDVIQHITDLGYDEKVVKYFAKLESDSKREVNVSEAVKETPKAETKPVVKEQKTETNYQPEGESKASKAALDVNKKLAEQGFDTLPEDELAQYDSHSKAGVIEKVTGLVTTDLEKAKEMARGKIPTPNDIHKQVLFNTVEAIAEKNGDFNTLYDLAQSPIATERSVAAQTLGASAWAKVKNTVVDKIQEVKKARTEKAEKQTRDFAKKEKEIRKSLKEETTKLNLNKEEVMWSHFLRSIAC